MNDPRSEPWLERSRALLDESLHEIDAATLSRLNRARQAALGKAHAQRPLWLGLSVLGATAVLVLAFGLSRQAPRHMTTPMPVTTPSAQADADVDLAAADPDSDELYENLDFYAWLAASGGPGQG